MKVGVTRHNGALRVDIDGRLYSPLSFKSFRANPANVSEFYRAGVRLFSVLSSGVTSALGVPYSLFGESWVGDGVYDFEPVDRQMDMFIANAPEGYFAPMIQLDTRDWYLRAHPEVPNSFTHLSQIAHDPVWRREAADYLKAMIEHLEERYGDRIYGYFMLCGTTTEWFSEGDFERSHPIKEAGFRRWCGRDDARIPSPERMSAVGDAFLSADEADVYEARRFHSETISELILYFAAEAQSVIRHEKLLGLYYGYLFELGGERLYNDGSFDYERIFMSDDINMISSPSAYGYRGLCDPSAFMLTARTLDLHNKLYFLEFDHITHVAPEEIREGRLDDASNCRLVKIPGAESKCRDEVESLNLMYRDFLLCTSNGTALWWFDMFDGWFRSDGMMGAVSDMVGLTERMALGERRADIAVFAEGESMYRARKCAGLATVTLSNIRRTLAECGAGYDLLSVSDIFSERVGGYKLYVFVNQYDIPRRRRERIDELLSAEGKRALWIYAPDYATGGACDVRRISEIVGMSVCESRRSHGGIVSGGEVYGYDVPAPYFAIDDSEAIPLACFEDGAVAIAERGGSFYCAAANLPSAVMREIARRSGAFIYSESARVYAYPRGEAVGFYNATGKDAEARVPWDGVSVDLISGRRLDSPSGKVILPQSRINAFLLISEENI